MQDHIDLEEAITKFIRGPLNSTIPRFLGLDQLADSLDTTWDSLEAQYLHTGLTGQQKAQNEWTAQREDTQYQRGVADMQAAGLNPAMMYGSSGQPAPSSQSAMPAGGASLSDMLELMSLPAKIKQMEASSDDLEASAAEKRSNTSLNEQLLQFNKEMQPLKKESLKLANDLSRSQRNKVEKEIDKIAEEMKKIAAETETEATKQLYNMAAAQLADAEAYQIYSLIPAKLMLMNAQTDQARAMARLSAVQAAYQSKLLKDGYVDAMCDLMKANAHDAQAKAAIDDFRSRIGTGDAFSWDAQTGFGKVVEQLIKGTLGYPLAAIDYILDKVNVGALLGIAGAGKAIAPSIHNAYDPFGYLPGE